MEILYCLKYQVRAKNAVLKLSISFKKEGTRAGFTGSVLISLNLSYVDSVSTEIFIFLSFQITYIKSL